MQTDMRQAEHIQNDTDSWLKYNYTREPGQHEEYQWNVRGYEYQVTCVIRKA